MILDDISKQKRLEVEARKKTRPVIPINGVEPARDFAAAIRKSTEGHVKIIAEVKKASPSKGVIRKDFNHTALALSYQEAGASAVSVLTDEKFFQGKLSYLTDCRKCISIPILRKDFIIDSYQIIEARAAGADAVLLIAALLNAESLRSFREYAESLGMSALVEAHNEKELYSAIESGARIIGINNRNLQTFDVDLRTTEHLIPNIPTDKIIVSESGIVTREDIERVGKSGADAILIGETLMRSLDPGQKLKELLSR